MGLELLDLAMLAAAAIGAAFFPIAALACGVFTALFAAATFVLSPRAVRPSAPQGGALPPVTVIKPLKGADEGLYENLASFVSQDYPCHQLVFCLASPDDPALPVVSRLKKAFPEADIETVVSSDRIGYNPKVNNMANAYPFAKYDLILMSDSDIRVDPGFLRRMAEPFADPALGMTTSFYQAVDSHGLWGHLEALSINAHFLPQSTLASSFGMRFAMGAGMMVRRQAFEASGAFANLADHLADDFWLGESVREAGWRLKAVAGCADTVPGISSGPEHFRHIVRWARTIRLCQPAGFYASLIQHGFSLLTLRLLVHPDALGPALMAAIWAVKAASSARLSATLGARQPGRALWLIPLSEWLAFGAWTAACTSDTVSWRGETFTVHERGRLLPAGRAPRALALES